MKNGAKTCSPEITLKRWLVLLCCAAAQGLALPASAAGESAEYAIRWSARDGAIVDAKAVLQTLKLKADDKDNYEIQYFDLQPPADAPAGFTSILRQRKKGRNKYELSFKYRGSTPITRPSLRDWDCPLPDADESKDETDVSFSAAAQAVQRFSRSCSVEQEGKPPAPPAALSARPRGCTSQMTRHTAGRLKIEEWTLPNGERLIEVSRTERDTPKARGQFQRDVVEPLLRAGIVPTDRSKTELGGNCG